MKRKVYVVTKVWYSDTTLIGVFSSKKKVQKYEDQRNTIIEETYLNEEQKT